jgi:phosphatidylserine/phosphatidylglycerophosphate/cardiolipin synthase-like enzyme
MQTCNFPHGHHFLFILILMLGLSSCNPSTPIVPTQVPVMPAAGANFSWIDIYFTDPSAPEAANYEGGPDEPLAAAIDKARLSVDMAANSLNLMSISDALIHAHQRGVVVRLVMESDNMDNQEVQQLQDAGIPIISDQQEGVMRDNFVVIDRNEVWTGSMDFTESGAYNDNNNLLHIRSKEVAGDYLVKFSVMFDKSLSDPDAGTATSNPVVTVDNSGLEVYFLPEEDVTARVKDLIMGASQSITYLSPELFGSELGGAILEIEQQVTVTGVLDSAMAEFVIPVPGTDVRADGNINGAMHESVMIIDQRIVIIGSYNFTSEVNEVVHGSNYSTNDSNVIIVNNPALADVFIGEFWRIYYQAQTQWPSLHLPTQPPSDEPTPLPEP